MIPISSSAVVSPPTGFAIIISPSLFGPDVLSPKIASSPFLTLAVMFCPAITVVIVEATSATSSDPLTVIVTPLIVNVAALNVETVLDPLTAGQLVFQASVPTCTQVPEEFLYHKVTKSVTATSA